MKLANPNFDKRNYLKRLETIVYLFLVLPLTFFGWVFLEKEKTGGLRSEFSLEQADMFFHLTMLTAITYVLMRTLVSWKKKMTEPLSDVETLDEKLRMLFRPILWRNFLWSIGAGIAAYGLHARGDMFYALFFTAFLVLITANRPSGRYFAKLLQLKGEEKKWMEQ